MHCLGHVSMHARYLQNNTQEQAKGKVTHGKHGDHFADERVSLLKVQQELEIEVKACLPSAQLFMAISCQTCQSYSILTYYPPANSRSAPFWEPDWQGARNCIPTHQCGLGFVSCCLVPRFTRPNGRGREWSLYTHSGPGFVTLHITHDRPQRWELWMKSWDSEAQQKSGS